MNVTEKARRSDSLHYDYVGRRTLCDMIANLESDLEDAKAESAKLRELVKDLYDTAEFSINYFGDTYDIRKRMDALGIEVDE